MSGEFLARDVFISSNVSNPTTNRTLTRHTDPTDPSSVGVFFVSIFGA